MILALLFIAFGAIILFNFWKKKYARAYRRMHGYAGLHNIRVHPSAPLLQKHVLHPSAAV